MGTVSLMAATPANASLATLTFPSCTHGTLNGVNFEVPSGATNLNLDFAECPTASPGQLAIATTASPPSSSTRANFTGSLDLFVLSANGPTPLSDYRVGTSGPPTLIPVGSYQVFYSWYANASLSATNTGSFTITVGDGGGGGGGSDEVTPPAPAVEISLTPTDGTTCSNSSESGSGGSWLNLPAASDCTPQAAKAGATLLGWATTPDFPVAIAQRQVNNGWGAYEGFNEDGQITAVFIPEGRAIFLSGANTLYAIWNQ
jgi:hypothetical protein